MLRRRRKFILAWIAGGLLIAGAYIILRSSVYEASAEIEIRPAGTNAFGLDEAEPSPSVADPTVRMESAAEIMRGDAVAMQVMQQLKLAERVDFAGRWQQPPDTAVQSLSPEVRDNLLARFRKALQVEIVPKTDILAVRFRARDAQLAANVVNYTLTSYSERKFRSSYDSARQVASWLSRQMEDLKTKANQSQERLAEFQKTSGLVGVDENDNIVTEKLKTLGEQLTAAEAERIVKEARFRLASSGNPELLATAVNDPALQLLRSQQAELRMQYAQLSTKFGSGYPKIGELLNQMSEVDHAIDAEQKNLGERYRNEYRAAASTEAELRESFEKQKQKVYDLSEGAAQYAILKHDVNSTQDLYQTLQFKLAQAGVVAGLAAANIGIVEAAEPPSEPLEPKPFLDLALGLSGGVVLGLMSAVALEAVDNTLRSSEEAAIASGLPVLAIIPEIARTRPGRKPAIDKRTPVSPQLAYTTHDELAESFRTLRSSLLLNQKINQPRVILVTSPMPGEGKTFLASNCAMALARKEARVLLVDADLRQPCLGEIFEASTGQGLSELLLTAGPPKENIARGDVEPGLEVLPAGSAAREAVERLGSQQLAALIEQWRKQFDHIVIDSPPLCLFSDALAFAPFADAVLVVARPSVTTRHALRHSLDMLHRSGTRIEGIVANGVEAPYFDAYYRPNYAYFRSGVARA